MHDFSKVFTTVLGLMLLTSVTSAAATGEQLYKSMTCFTCHGENGKNAILDYPELAGQNAKYALRQMKDIAKGKRVASEDDAGIPRTQNMQNIMQTMTKKQMKVIANWLSEEPIFLPELSAKASDENIAQGAKIYKKLRCATCHGKGGAKPRKGDPIIAGQKRDYLAQQMLDIKAKIRNNAKSKTMVSFIKKASDEDIGFMADYLSQSIKK